MADPTYMIMDNGEALKALRCHDCGRPRLADYKCDGCRAKSEYDRGVTEGKTTQAILEIQGRDRFLEELRKEQAIESDAEKPCRAGDHSRIIGTDWSFCPYCGRNIRTD